MNVSLTPELVALVNRKVESGMYQTASEVVREALRLLSVRDDKLAALRRDIGHASDQIKRGEYTDYGEHSMDSLADGVKRRGRRRARAARKTGTG